MGKAKKTRKFAQMKRMIGQRDSRLKKNQQKEEQEQTAAKSKGDGVVREIPNQPAHLFFSHNTALTPPYQILIDTNFLSLSIHHKLEPISNLMNALYATVTPLITDCVLAELEKLGPKYRLALRLAKAEGMQRISCDHKGVYADDCIVDRCVKHRIYLVATNDQPLKRRIRKIPGVPIVSVKRGGCAVERLPDVPEK